MPDLGQSGIRPDKEESSKPSWIERTETGDRIRVSRSATSISEQVLGYHDESYEAYVASLEPCPGCGRVDEMDNIGGRSLCAACSLDKHDADEWDEFGYDEELRT
jgi:hypothetical protein